MRIPHFYPSGLGVHSCRIRKWLSSGKPIWHVTSHPQLDYPIILCSVRQLSFALNLPGVRKQTSRRACWELTERQNQQGSLNPPVSIQERESANEIALIFPLQQWANGDSDDPPEKHRSQYELKRVSSNHLGILSFYSSILSLRANIWLFLSSPQKYQDKYLRQSSYCALIKK